MPEMQQPHLAGSRVNIYAGELDITTGGRAPQAGPGETRRAAGEVGREAGLLVGSSGPPQPWVEIPHQPCAWSPQQHLAMRLGSPGQAEAAPIT
jgi:hypothetical protein